jgi:hypothetical protein
MTPSLAKNITGGLSSPSKMPGFAFSIPAQACNVGSKLRAVAGSICSKCYALKGHYTFPNVKNALSRRLEGLTHPLWVDAMAFLINSKAVNVFRWHDSGDIQSLAHLENITKVCEATPDVRHWIPTREYAVVSAFKDKHGKFPDNLTVRLSALMMDGPLPTGAADRLGVTVSGVTSDPEKVTCPAYKQGGICGSCRACWNKETPVVYYPKH